MGVNRKDGTYIVWQAWWLEEENGTFGASGFFFFFLFTLATQYMYHRLHRSLTLSLSLSLSLSLTHTHTHTHTHHRSRASFPPVRSSKFHLVSVKSKCMEAFADQPTLSSPRAGVKRRKLLTSLSLLPTPWCTSLVYFAWMNGEMAGKWPYRYYFMKCCFQNLLRQHAAWWNNSHLAFPQCLLFVSMWSSHIVV